MKSNYQMLVTFKDWTPQKWGWVTNDEVDIINKHFAIKERSSIELQNLRDFVVMYYSIKMDNDSLTPREKFTQSDIMSAITGVIDIEKNRRGMEV